MSEVGELVAAGRTSDVYEYAAGAVVKVPRPDVPSHWAAEEARITAAVWQLGAPAPAVLDVVDVSGRDAIVFERIDGRSMWDLIVENPGAAADWGQRLAEVHCQVLRAGMPDDVDGLVERMYVKIASAPLLSQPDREDAIRRLERLPRGAALLHGDLHPANVLMSPTGPFVIDWFDASIGHPVADVVRSSILMRPLDGVASRPHLPGADPLVLRELHDAYIRAMGVMVSSSHDEVRQWEAVVAAGRLAEGAEADETPLLALWSNRDADRPSFLGGALSREAPGVNRRSSPKRRT